MIDMKKSINNLELLKNNINIYFLIYSLFHSWNSLGDESNDIIINNETRFNNIKLIMLLNFINQNMDWI